MTDLDMNSEKLKANIREIVLHVENNISGRMANTYGDIRLDNVDTLLEFVAKAGGGNHLEIGTLFGGSAIAVAMLKEKLGHDGVVICIDPLDGYYSQIGSGKDLSGVPVSVQTLFENITTFGVEHRIMVMKEYSSVVMSINIPLSTAYIDGDHRGLAPTMDWKLVKDITAKYVIFDNCDNKHPDVIRACDIANDDPDWKCVYSRGITHVVERINEL